MIIALIASFNIYAQNLVARGKITAKKTEDIIRFATLTFSFNEKLHVHYCDSAGIYQLIIPKYVDSITISCVGYKSLSMPSQDFAKTNKIVLDDLPYTLNEVKISLNQKRRKIFRLGSFKEANKTVGYGSIGLSDYISKSDGKYHNYVAALIHNPKQDTSLLISKLLYNLTNNPKHLDFILQKLNLHNSPCENTRLRVHLFTVDPQTKKPKNELLKRNIIIQNNCNSSGDLVIDISDQNIFMPTTGVFVALEYIDLLPLQRKVYYPFYLTKFNSKNPNTYESYQQKNWIKMKGGSQETQFGIEVIK